MRHPRRHPHHGEKYSNIDINPKSTMNSTDCNQLDPSPPQVRKRGRPFKKKSNKLVHFSQSSPNSLSDTLSVSITKISHESETFYANKMYKSPILSTSDDSISQYTRELRPRTTITTPPPPPPPPTTTTTSNCHPPVKRYLRRRDKFRRIPHDIPNNSLHDSLSTVDKLCEHSVQTHDDHNNAILEEDDDDEEEEEEDERQTRRYPMRNRRNTTVYQVENPHISNNNNNNNNHNNPQQQRNWLVGTGYDKYKRSRQLKSKFGRNWDHRGSSTSSSSSASDGSLYDRGSIRRSWGRLHYSTKENKGPITTIDNDVDEKHFERRRNKSTLNARSELMPINKHQFGYEKKSTIKDKSFTGSCLADIEPMSIDSSVGFEQIGGNENHILALKESIILPLMYPEVFIKFNVEPPRGVLFSGPPGTGKTLLARALANECSRLAGGNDGSVKQRRAIAFFMRKGADCLSKWVGESERQLRLLFDQAYRMRPSVIFFDEIDGLAPIRSSKQDQIHSSIVSTLLSLMDGLDNRAEVVVIGATNRPDAIDPALRRPGRFDREFTFTLPSETVRRRILEVITSKWDPKPDSLLLDRIAATTINFSGADLKALTTEACLCCLRRCYPQVYNSHVKLALEHKYLVVSHSDWFEALQIVCASGERCNANSFASNLTPSANALAATIRTPLSPNLSKLLMNNVDQIVYYLKRALFNPRYDINNSMDTNKSLTSQDISSYILKSKLFINGNISDTIMNAVWYKLETLQVFTINLANLFAFPTSIGMCPEAAVAQIISSIRHTVKNSSSYSFKSNLTGVIIYLPCIDILIESIPQLTANYFIDNLIALLNEINCELNYIPSFFNTLQTTTNDLNDSIINKQKLLYATLRSSCRVVIVGTCTHRQRYTSTTINSSKQQYNSNLINTKTYTSIYPSFFDKLQEGKCQTTNGICVSNESSSSSPLIHIKSSSNSITPTVHCVNNITPIMKYAYNQELAKIQLQFTIHLSDYYKNPLQLHSNSIPITENLTIDEKNNTNIHSSEYTTDINDDDDDCERNLNRQNSSHSNVNSILSKLFDNNHTEFINLKPPNKDERYSFFYSVLIDWPQLTYLQLLDIREKSVNSSDRHIPSPQPIVEEDLPPKSTYPVHYTPEELAVIESREMQLFRRLRQVLRRVVAHLASFRRFTVFTRPVQIDEAPDYYDVIKQPMDLGSIRDKIDCHQYHNVNDFMKDIELVYRNALEYNPANIPRSRDIRSRAYEFWDEACIRMEEELQPVDLNELCEEALSARAARLSNEKMVKTPSTMKKKETECRSTHRNDENLQKSSIKQPLPPLPQGDRYSRRLHGESPILELNDILQLQSCSSRRRSTFTPSTRKSVSVLQTNQHTPDLDISMSSFDVVLKPSESSTHDLDSKLTIEPLLESDVSSSSPKQLYLSKSSPIGKSPTPSQQQQQQSTPLQIDLQRLNHFLDRVVVKTDGWSTMQLVNLHTDFTNIILWKYAHITNRLSLSDDFENILANHQMAMDTTLDNNSIFN